MIQRTTAVALVFGFLSSAASVEASPSVSAEIQAVGATTFVSRGHPVYAGRTDPVVLNGGKLALKYLGPGSLALDLKTATALLHHSTLDGRQLEVATYLKYSLPLSKTTRVSAGFGVKVYPYAQSFFKYREITTSVEHDWAGFTFGVHAWIELVKNPGPYLVGSVARPLAFGDFTLTPSVGTGINVRKESGLQFNDFAASLEGEWDLTSSVFLLGSACYALGYMDGEGSFAERSTAWASLGAGVRF